MKLLVTGGAGFIGSAFVAHALEQGDTVIVLDALTYAGHRANLTWLEPSYGDKLELVVGNICDGPLVARLLEEKQPDAIVSFAAESHVDNSIASPGEFIHTNIIGTYTLLEAARAYATDKPDFRFVQISTDEVYGSLGEEGKFHEEYPMQPNSPYSASKAAGDHLARAWFHTYGLQTIVTNCSNNYGPRQFPEKLIPLMITNALAGKPLPIYGDGKNIRDWIHVEDHVAGVYLALVKGAPGETYCFGGHAEKTNNDVVQTLCAALDDIQPRPQGSYGELITYVEDRAGHDRRYAIDDSKAQNELGFTRTHTFETGLHATIQWYLANGNWCEEVVKNVA